MTVTHSENFDAGGGQYQLSESDIEELASEREDRESSAPSFEVVTYPADFTLEGLVSKYQTEQIKIPGFQRKFVWTLPQASRLIESFLLGLPVPAVFLLVDPTDKSLIVMDGQQRLLSVFFFFEGLFSANSHGVRPQFALRGLHEKSAYRDKTYLDLKDTDPAAFNTLNNAVLRAFVVQQLNSSEEIGVLHPSALHIFERLNTGGTQLVNQEIRNCMYGGPFNDLLGRLNRHSSWRSVFGKPNEDKRQRDVELVLRFLALHENAGSYTKPMKDFLSKFMSHHRRASPDRIRGFETLFTDTMDSLLDKLGERPFHIKSGLNAAVFDAVSTAFSKHLGRIPEDMKQRYVGLVQDATFLGLVSAGTTDESIVSKRLEYAEQALFT